MNLLDLLRQYREKRRQIAELEVAVLNKQIEARDAELRLRASLAVGELLIRDLGQGWGRGD